MATAGAAMLNRTRDGPWNLRPSHREMTRLSKTTIIVAAAGPNIRTAANTNVSETDSRAGIVGIRIVNEPLSSVSPASNAQ